MKKHWYLILIALFTLGLGVVVYLTSKQLATTEQVAPTAPKAQPQAAAPACKLEFAITGVTGTPTPTPTPTPTVTPTPTPTPEATGTPTPTPTPGEIVYVYPTPTPQPVAYCNNACVVNADCAGALVCIGGVCRNASCTDDTSCSCGAAPIVTPQPTPKTPVSGGPTVLGISVLGIGMLILILGLAL